MVTAIIADDEPLLRRELREALEDLWPELEITAEPADGAAALRAIEASQPTIAFLDIRMPKLSGLEVAERVQGECHVVFVTAYDQHAIAAFEQGAVDYVLKPIRHVRLAATVKRLQQRLLQVTPPDASGRTVPLEWIQATVGNRLRFISINDVYYFRSDGKYTRVVTAEADAVIRRSIAALHETLDQNRFLKIHRGTVVSVEHIDSVIREEGGAMTVRLRNGRAELPVSKAHQGLFRGM
jgi:DNA-binding LytR/AlgR family response regulator